MKNIVVTGANKGLGLEFTRQLSKDNHVIATARNISSEHELHSLPNVKIKKLDLLSDATIDQLKENMPELPDQMRLRLEEEYNLSVLCFQISNAFIGY